MSERAHYSSHPIANYKVGRFQFTKGVLALEGPEAEEFDALLATQPLSVTRKVKKATRETADAVARKFMEGRMIAGVDTTANSVEAPPAESQTERPTPAEPASTKPFSFGTKSAE